MIFFAIGDQRKASSRVRVFWISERVQTNVKVISGLDGPLVFWYGLKNIREEIIVLQKNASRYFVFYAKCLKKLGKKVFFDLDDYPDPNNSKVTMRNFEEICKSVDGILVGSPNLLELCVKLNPRTFLLPTGIKIENYTINNFKQTETICLGWIGNGNHYANDLIAILVEPLRELTKTYRLKLKIVGSANNQMITDSFSEIPGLEFEHIGGLNWADPKVIDNAMDEFDIGLYPLIENKSNKFKCGFKALEYYAKGIPVISSDVTMNKDIVLHDKTGYVVNTAEEWKVALEKLIKDVELRGQMGEAGYQHVKENNAIEKIAARFEEIVLND